MTDRKLARDPAEGLPRLTAEQKAAAFKKCMRELVAGIPLDVRRAWVAELEEHKSTGKGFQPGWSKRQMERLNANQPKKER